MKGVRMQDVADLAGVSMKTVSNVVRDYPHVSSAMRERVQRAIAELDYRPNMLGRQLATGRTGLVALACADVAMPYFAEMAGVVSAAARRHGYRLLLEQTDGTLEGERSVVSSNEAGLVDGMIFQPNVMTSVELAQRRGDVPMVLIGEGPAPISVDRVMIDNIAAASEATEHLAALGRTRIGFVGHEENGPTATSKERLIGYQKGLERSGLTLDMSLLVPSAAVSAADAARAVGAALDAGLRVDGLVCRDDLAAIGALRALQERGFAVPDDVAVVGWDDIMMAAVTFPSITTVRPDITALADVALDLLNERIAGFDGLGRHRLVAHELVIRESAPATDTVPAR